MLKVVVSPNRLGREKQNVLNLRSVIPAGFYSLLTGDTNVFLPLEGFDASDFEGSLGQNWSRGPAVLSSYCPSFFIENKIIKIIMPDEEEGYDQYQNLIKLDEKLLITAFCPWSTDREANISCYGVEKLFSLGRNDVLFCAWRTLDPNGCVVVGKKSGFDIYSFTGGYNFMEPEDYKDFINSRMMKSSIAERHANLI